MGDTDFYDAVGERADLDAATADAATLATLAVLGDHLSGTVVADLVGPLPDGAADAFAASAADPPTAFAYEEFVRRVADRLDVDEGEAERRARAVGATLAARVDGEALADARDQLPEAFDRLFWVPTTGEILARVERATDVDGTAAAREATTAVLATLGERITPGQAAAFAAYLPDEFASALAPAADVPDGSTRPAAGNAGTGGDAETGDGAGEDGTDRVPGDYDVDEFVARVADLEGVDRERARRHVGAVFDALAGAVPPDEVEDLLDQLPDAYGTVL